MDERFDVVEGLTKEWLEYGARCFPWNRQLAELAKNPPVIRFDLEGKAGGRVTYKNGKFEIKYNSEPIMNGAYQEFLRQTVPHEVAHVVAIARFGGMIKPHGSEWKYVMGELFGKDTKATTNYSLSRKKKTTLYLYECACGVHEFGPQRHRKSQRGVTYRCTGCKQPVRYNPNAKKKDEKGGEAMELTKEERQELVNLAVNVLGFDKKKAQKRSSTQIFNLFERARMGPESIKTDEEFKKSAHNLENKPVKMIGRYIDFCRFWRSKQEAERNAVIENTVTVGEAPGEKETENQPTLPQPKDSGPVQVKDAPAKSLGRFIKDRISEGRYTWDEIVQEARLYFPKRSNITFSQYRADFKNPKYAPKEGLMATAGDGTVQWI